jgi:hypothetical protein
MSPSVALFRQPAHARTMPGPVPAIETDLFSKETDLNFYETGLFLKLLEPH